MLEICFNDSVKGALKVAQHCGNKKLNGPIGFFTTTNKNKLRTFFEKRKALQKIKKEQKELQKQAISLGGKSEDVLAISFCLFEGDIATPIELEKCPRKDFISSLLTFNDYGGLGDVEKCALKIWQNVMSDLETLKQGAEKVRIWVDSTPAAACGMLFVADLLVNTDTEIHIVTLPKKYQSANNCFVEYFGWGEVPPQLFGTFLTYESILTKEEIGSLSMEWQKLQSENAPLRVVVEDKIISAREDYYDN